MLCKLKGGGHCTSAKRITRILRHVAEAFPPARQETILINSHGVIDIANNTSMVNGAKLRLSDLHHDGSRCRTAGCSITS